MASLGAIWRQGTTLGISLYDIIKLNAIVAKCVLLINEDDYFLSIFNVYHANMD